MTQVRGKLLASIASLVVFGFVTTNASADQLLTGSIVSASGQKLEGVLVSAKQDGSTITTSVYTDTNGDYFFPPLADGKYQVWAQTLGFQTTRGGVDLDATKHQDFKLAAITDPEERVRQLPPEMLQAALPEDTEADANIKHVFHNQCTGCHTPGYPLQFKFDEAGWNKVINLMKVIPQLPGPNARVNGIINYNQKELAAYLARARGPGETSMKFKDRPRPTGDAARVMWKTYEVPLNPDSGIASQGVKYNTNDGSDWSLGVTSRIGQLPHDGGMDFDGNLYYTVNAPNRNVTVGKVDGKTGEVKYLKIEKREGFENLPRLLLEGLRRPPLAVMIARGDLAVEVGFERLAELQEEVLWLCEASHVPAIWATQVLDMLARTGVPSRAEVTDAAASVAAECVMLNKGPFVDEAVIALSDILGRMEKHQYKKRILFRKLRVSTFAEPLTGGSEKRTQSGTAG